MLPNKWQAKTKFETTRSVFVLCVSRSQAFSRFSTAFVSIRKIFARNSVNLHKEIARFVRNSLVFARIHNNFTSMHKVYRQMETKFKLK